MKTGYSVSDAMSTKPITIPGSITVRDASKIMQQHDIGSLIILDGEKLVGIVTAEDFVHRVTATAKSSAETIVADVMTDNLVTIGPQVDIYDAMAVMAEHNIFHLPVVDAATKLLGFLTLKDILRIEPQLFEIMGELGAINGRQKPTSHKPKEGYCQQCGNYSEELVEVKNRWLCQYCSEE